MGRPLRFEYPGAIYHITSRGNDGQEIYKNHADRLVFLEKMAKVRSRFGWVFYAYCLMSNHYHLVVETPKANLSKGMAQLNGGYARLFNQRHKATGHLFQSRFRGLLVQRETYLLTVIRYAVLNPVRAGICKHPEDFPYSSYGEMLNPATRTSLVESERVLALFGRDRESGRAAYREFVLQGIRAKTIHEEVRSRIFLGDEGFVAVHTIDLSDETMSEIVGETRPDPKPPLRHLIKDPKDWDSIYFAYREWGYTMRQLGQHIGKHYSTVSRMIKEYEAAQQLTREMQQRKT